MHLRAHTMLSVVRSPNPKPANDLDISGDSGMHIKSFVRHGQASTVALKVGSSGRIFHVDRDKLIKQSSVLRSMIAQREMEDGIQLFEDEHFIIYLSEGHDDDVCILIKYVYWAPPDDMESNKGKDLLRSATFFNGDLDFLHRGWSLERQTKDNWSIEVVEDHQHTDPVKGMSERKSISMTHSANAQKQPQHSHLIRLYILAHKYGFHRRLKVLICARLQQVAERTRCVPSLDNIALLYEKMAPGVEHKSNATEDTQTDEDEPNCDLRKTILKLYLTMDTNSAHRILSYRTYDHEDKWQWQFFHDLLLETYQQNARKK